MGDETQVQQQPQLSEGTDSRAKDPPSLPTTNLQSVQQPKMEFEPYPRQHFSVGPYPGTTSLDMAGMANALPEYQLRQFQQTSFQQQYNASGTPTQSMMYQYHQSAQFAGQTASNYSQAFPQHFPPQYMQAQQRHAAYPQFVGGAPPPGAAQPFAHQAFVLPQHMIPGSTTAMPQNPQHFLQPPTGAQYGGGYGPRMGGAYQMPQLRLDSNLPGSPGMGFYPQLSPQGMIIPLVQYFGSSLTNEAAVRRTSSNSSLQTSAIRGPPRKPKQSGHALWVGNLPPGTHIADLKDHFSRDATEDIESVFLISKSNCAFVNYKTEASCTAAMSRFHDSRFQNVRLVCRLRRGSTSTSGPTPTIPNPSGQQPTSVTDGGSNAGSAGAEKTVIEEEEEEQEAITSEPEPTEKVKEKFFVVKSLTIEDLERSVSSGVWATQSHNETALNNAYQTAENVYLVFSANKSGEYFGYARMDSAIGDEAVANIELQPRPELPEPSPSDLPLTIPTPATATAPKGRIIDDSARGTIFWEAEPEEKDEQSKEEDAGNLSGDESGVSTGPSPATPQTFGKPFKITWMSTDRLPFYRTRGLRNPWNANREVKIARDGTEIEPSVGRRLISMFHRPQILSTSPILTRQPHLLGGMSGYVPQQGPMPGPVYGTSF